MTIQTVFIYVLIGMLAAFLAAWLMPKSKFGLLGDLVSGIVGSFLGGWFFLQLGIYVSGIIWPVAAALLGGIVFTIIPRLLSLV
jgi:uncharacterized membrane protein YeaQ/YmgE (transglycosylase-associated protein family)